ncbi:MAG TPA: hypothetical protein DEF45_19710 [Rhodopirellula sp.]|nr:hypothetical protein [Rhodopirellula sp.]
MVKTKRKRGIDDQINRKHTQSTPMLHSISNQNLWRGSTKIHRSQTMSVAPPVGLQTKRVAGAQRACTCAHMLQTHSRGNSLSNADNPRRMHELQID